MARYGQAYGWSGRDRMERQEWRGTRGRDYGSEFGQGVRGTWRGGGLGNRPPAWEGSGLGRGRGMQGGFGEDQWGGGYGAEYEDWGRARGGMGGFGGQRDYGGYGSQGSNAYGGYGMSSGFSGGQEQYGAQGYGGQSHETGYGGYSHERGGYSGGMGGRWRGGRQQGSQQQSGSNVRASQIMTENPECVTPDTTLAEVAKKMRDLNVGIIPVVESEENRRLKGVVTDRDITVRAVAEGKDASRIKASEVMTIDVDSVNKNDSVRDVLQIMQSDQVRRVPVTDREGRLVGIISQADVAVDFAEPGHRRQQVEHTLERISEPARPSRGGQVGGMEAGGAQQQSSGRSSSQSGGAKQSPASSRSGGSSRSSGAMQASGSQQSQQGQQPSSQGKQQS
jgi:CBS domain-containing protein